MTLLKFVPDHLARAYKGAVSFTTPKTQRRHGASGGGGRIPAAVNGSAAATTEGVNGGTDAPQVSRLTCHYLMVRLEKQETDVLLFLNVPHDEFDAQGDARGLSREEEMATGLIERIIETLEVKDWGVVCLIVENGQTRCGYVGTYDMAEQILVFCPPLSPILDRSRHSHRIK